MKRLQERGGGNDMKVVMRRRYEYTFMICVHMVLRIPHSIPCSEWWNMFYEKAQMKLENRKNNMFLFIINILSLML